MPIEHRQSIHRLAAALDEVTRDVQAKVEGGCPRERLIERCGLVIALATEIQKELQGALALQAARRQAADAINKARST